MADSGGDGVSSDLPSWPWEKTDHESVTKSSSFVTCGARITSGSYEEQSADFPLDTVHTAEVAEVAASMSNGLTLDLQEDDNEPDDSEGFKMEDVLGNGTLYKHILIKGNGKRCNLHEKVTVHMVSEIPSIRKIFPQEILEFVVGDGDVVQALDLAVAIMEVGEEAKIFTGYEYMYGELGVEPSIPGYANFKLQVRLLSSEPWDYETMSIANRLEEAKKKRDRGNFMFQRNEIDRAVQSYSLGERILETSTGKPYADEAAETLQEILDCRATILSNMSAAVFKMGRYKLALKAAQKSVDVNPRYSQGYLRLGKAQGKLGYKEASIRSFKRAMACDKPPAKSLSVSSTEYVPVAESSNNEKEEDEYCQSSTSNIKASTISIKGSTSSINGSTSNLGDSTSNINGSTSNLGDSTSNIGGSTSNIKTKASGSGLASDDILLSITSTSTLHSNIIASSNATGSDTDSTPKQAAATHSHEAVGDQHSDDAREDEYSDDFSETEYSNHDRHNEYSGSVKENEYSGSVKENEYSGDVGAKEYSDHASEKEHAYYSKDTKFLDHNRDNDYSPGARGNGYLNHASENEYSGPNIEYEYSGPNMEYEYSDHVRGKEYPGGGREKEYAHDSRFKGYLDCAREEYISETMGYEYSGDARDYEYLDCARNSAGAVREHKYSGVAKENEYASGVAKENEYASGVAKENEYTSGVAKENEYASGVAKENEYASGVAKENEYASGVAKENEYASDVAKENEYSDGARENEDADGARGNEYADGARIDEYSDYVSSNEHSSIEQSHYMTDDFISMKLTDEDHNEMPVVNTEENESVKISTDYDDYSLDGLEVTEDIHTESTDSEEEEYHYPETPGTPAPSPVKKPSVQSQAFTNVAKLVEHMARNLDGETNIPPKSNARVTSKIKELFKPRLHSTPTSSSISAATTTTVVDVHNATNSMLSDEPSFRITSLQSQPVCSSLEYSPNLASGHSTPTQASFETSPPKLVLDSSTPNNIGVPSLSTGVDAEKSTSAVGVTSPTNSLTIRSTNSSIDGLHTASIGNFQLSPEYVSAQTSPIREGLPSMVSPAYHMDLTSSSSPYSSTNVTTDSSLSCPCSPRYDSMQLSPSFQSAQSTPEFASPASTPRRHNLSTLLNDETVMCSPTRVVCDMSSSIDYSNVSSLLDSTMNEHTPEIVLEQSHVASTSIPRPQIPEGVTITFPAPPQLPDPLLTIAAHSSAASSHHQDINIPNSSGSPECSNFTDEMKEDARVAQLYDHFRGMRIVERAFSTSSNYVTVKNAAAINLRKKIVKGAREKFVEERIQLVKDRMHEEHKMLLTEDEDLVRQQLEMEAMIMSQNLWMEGKVNGEGTDVDQLGYCAASELSELEDMIDRDVVTYEMNTLIGLKEVGWQVGKLVVYVTFVGAVGFAIYKQFAKK